MTRIPELPLSLQSSYPPPLLLPPSLASSPQISSTSTLDQHMGRDKEKSRIDIVLDSPHVQLRGTTGTTVDPAVLSGHVSLYLVEDTDIREITLHFRGKAKVPVPSSESLINNPTQSHVFCSHDWTFLETTTTNSQSSSFSKRPHHHVRTLKAGRHIFPFTFTLNGNLPSTISSSPLSLFNSAFPSAVRASISYKLRAVASRPGLHIMPHNFTSTMPVYVLRSLTPEALEYQHTLEMENTWPEKLMYSIMLPHRAWAAGDTLISVFKLSPIAKGVRVENIVTTLWETTELHAQLHPNKQTHDGQAETKVVHTEKRIVRCTKHDIINGKAFRVDLVGSSTTSPKLSRNSNESSRPSSSMDGSSSRSASFGRAAGPPMEEETQINEEEFENHDIVTYLTFPVPHLASGPYINEQTATTLVSAMPQSRPPTPPLHGSSYSYTSSPPPTPSTSSAPIPSFNPFSTATINPTHNLPPIVVSHRIRWSLYIRNRDGHISELRCSLPIHILDGRVLAEAREASVLTRRMALVAEGLWRGEEEEEEELDLGAAGSELNENGSGAGAVNGDFFVDRELPSYHSHLRDRVANMYYSETSTVRVPWVDIVADGEGTSGNVRSDDDVAEGGSSRVQTQLPRRRPYSMQYQSNLRTSGTGSSATPAPRNHHQLLQVSSSSSSSSVLDPLNWVDSELTRTQHVSTTPQLHTVSETPETTIGLDGGSQSRGHGTRTSSGSGNTSQSVRNLTSLLKATMRPLRALNFHSHGHGLLGHSKPSPSPTHNTGPRRAQSLNRSSGSSLLARRASIPPILPSQTSSMLSNSLTSSSSSATNGASRRRQTSLFHRPISQVPDYAAASQGFMGGVPPLSSLMGLPSYEEASREGQRQRRSQQRQNEEEEEEEADSDTEEALSSSIKLNAGFSNLVSAHVGGSSSNGGISNPAITNL